MIPQKRLKSPNIRALGLLAALLMSALVLCADTLQAEEGLTVDEIANVAADDPELAENANEEQGLAEIANAIKTLQPAADEERAARLAKVFKIAGREYDHDPLLLVAIAFRESSLLRSVEENQRRGSRGEVGLMQSHGAALTLRPRDCHHDLIGARCQVSTGAAWLRYARQQCGGSWWRWIAAYGMSACPSERLARRVPSAKVAYRYYEQIGGTRWQ